MTTSRLETFSDGVIAIIITIMVLELKVPHGNDLNAVRPLLAPLFTYVLSFIFLGIYWNNHHHMLHVAERVNGKILWANLHLLFWLSLIPVVTGWMGESRLAMWPTAIYGVVLLLAAFAYLILEKTLVTHHGPESRVATAMGIDDTKEKISTALYVVAIPLAFVHPWIAAAIYLLVALMWLVPDRRIEAMLER